MIAFVIRRLGQSFLVMFFVALTAFGMFHYIGDPVNQMVAEDATVQEVELLREQLGLNDPPVIQFFNFAWKAAQGNFGFSYQHKRPVADMISESMPATIELATTSAIFALLVGLPLGVYTGLRRYGFASKLVMTISLIGISLPTFLIGILFIYLFAVILGWLRLFSSTRSSARAAARSQYASATLLTSSLRRTRKSSYEVFCAITLRLTVTEASFSKRSFSSGSRISLLQSERHSGSSAVKTELLSRRLTL